MQTKKKYTIYFAPEKLQGIYLIDEHVWLARAQYCTIHYNLVKKKEKEKEKKHNMSKTTSTIIH